MVHELHHAARLVLMISVRRMVKFVPSTPQSAQAYLPAGQVFPAQAGLEMAPSMIESCTVYDGVPDDWWIAPLRYEFFSMNPDAPDARVSVQFTTWEAIVTFAVVIVQGPV
jgi:hypothetical protein